MMSSMLLAAFAVAATAACGFQDCATYCSGECPFRPNISSTGVESMKVWRITPWNVTGLADHNTGDAAGDMGFLMQKYMTNSNCKPPYVTSECFLDDLPIVAEFRVEFDGQYGPYLHCNPIPIPGSKNLVDTGHFLCAYEHPGDDPWAPNGASCPVPCNRANISVGKDPAHHVWNTTADAKRHLSSYFGGYWYSTEAQSECKAGTAPGIAGCTWRTTAPAKYVNASCLADQLFKVLEKKNPTCFGECAPGAGRGDHCFGGCVESTVLGEPVGAGLGVNVAEMVVAWESGFTGACPLITPSELGKSIAAL